MTLPKAMPMVAPAPVRLSQKDGSTWNREVLPEKLVANSAMQQVVLALIVCFRILKGPSRHQMGGRCP
jgi:hypothetical protein